MPALKEISFENLTETLPGIADINFDNLITGTEQPAIQQPKIEDISFSDLAVSAADMKLIVGLKQRLGAEPIGMPFIKEPTGLSGDELTAARVLVDKHPESFTKADRVALQRAEAREHPWRALPSQIKSIITAGIAAPFGWGEAIAPGLTQELSQDLAAIPGPGTGELAAEGIDVFLKWKYVFPALFKAVGFIGKIPYAAKATSALKRATGLSKLSQVAPRAERLISSTVANVAKGMVVGGGYTGIELYNRGMSLEDAKPIIIRNALTMGAIAGAFGVAGFIDTQGYVKNLRQNLLKTNNARFATRASQINSEVKQLQRLQFQAETAKDQGKIVAIRRQLGEASRRLKGLQSLKRAKIDSIDRIVSEVEGQLINVKAGRLYQTGQREFDSPIVAAQKFIQSGEISAGIPAGIEQLQVGLAPRQVDVLTGRPISGRTARAPTGAVPSGIPVPPAGRPVVAPTRPVQPVTPAKPIAALKPAEMTEQAIKTLEDKAFKLVDRNVFKEIVAQSVQKDGQRLLDAIDKRDIETLHKLALKYQREWGLDEGGGGAGPGKVKQARAGTVQIAKLAREAHDLIKPAKPAVEGKVAFHGTLDKSVKELKPSKRGDLGEGLYLARDKNVAGRFADMAFRSGTLEAVGDGTFQDINTGKIVKPKAPGIIQVDISAIKIKQITPQEFNAEIEKLRDPKTNVLPPNFETLAQKSFKKAGFDGIEIAGSVRGESDQIVVFPESVNKVAKPAPAAKEKIQPITERLEKPPVIEKVVSKLSEIPKAPQQPVTEQKPTIDLKAKETQVFNEAVRTQEKITAAEQGEVGIEPAGASFTDHLDTFHSYQLPATSKLPGIVHKMKVINGRRLAGKLTPSQANRMIYNLRKDLVQAAIREKIALRVSKIGKVRIGLRKSGVFVPEGFAKYTKYKDIEPLLGGGQDITRAIQQMDGSLRLREKVGIEAQAGPLERYVLWRTRTMTLQKLNWLKEKTIEIREILSARKGSTKDKEINLILEKIGKADRDAPIKNVLGKETFASMSKESVKAAQELRQFYDDLIEEENAARLMRGQDPIPYRQNYSPHILRDTTVWEQLLMRDKTAKDLEKADLPDYIKPNAPFNPRAQAREADMPYDKRVLSARELAESYIITAAKDIFNTSIIQNNKAFIEQLRSMGYEKSANYLGEWTATAYAGIKPGLDRHIKLPKWAEKSLRYFNRLRNLAVFPLNVAWSLSTQPLSLSNTVGRYGLPNTVRGFYQWLKPSIRRQAAQDYYSFIVKSTRRGGVTRQDAANLLGENIKTTKTVGEFIENFTTILLTEMEKLLTGMSIRAAHLHGLKKGLKGEALKQYASDGGGKTQSMYNDEDKPMVLRSLLVKSAAPYQTYAFEVANTFREWAGKTGTPPDTKLYAMWSVTRWLAAMIVLRLLANQTRGKKWSWWDLIPIPFKEAFYSPIVRAITGEFRPTGYGLIAPVGTLERTIKGVIDVLETGSWRKLRNELMRYGPGVLHPKGLGIPGGVQWSRMVDAIIAYSNGGVFDRRGRLLFKLDTPEDLARGMFTGVWSTKAGRKRLERKKPTERTRLANP